MSQTMTEFTSDPHHGCVLPSFVVVVSLSFVLLFLPPLVLRRWLVLVFFFFNFTTNQLYNVRSLDNSRFNGISKEAKGFEHYLFFTFTGFTHIVAYEVTLFLFYVIEFNSFAGREQYKDIATGDTSSTLSKARILF